MPGSSKHLPDEIEPADARAEQAGQRIARRRRCAVCGTALSGYNDGPHCWRHSVGMPWRGPSAKPKFD